MGQAVPGLVPFDDCVITSFTNRYVLVSAGNFLLSGGDEQGAEAAYLQALERPSGYAYFEALNTLARIRARRGELDSAAQLCEQAIAWNPYYPKAFALLAQIESAAGRPDGAAAAVRRGLIHNPNDPDLNKLSARASAPPRPGPDGVAPHRARFLQQTLV